MEPLSHKTISFTRQKKVGSQKPHHRLSLSVHLLSPIAKQWSTPQPNLLCPDVHSPRVGAPRCSQTQGGCTQMLTALGWMHPDAHSPGWVAPRCSQTQGGCTQVFTDPGRMHPDVHIPRVDEPRCSRPQGWCIHIFTDLGWMHPGVYRPRMDAPKYSHSWGGCTQTFTAPGWSYWIRTGWNVFVRVIELGRNEKLKAILMTQTTVIHHT